MDFQNLITPIFFPPYCTCYEHNYILQFPHIDCAFLSLFYWDGRRGLWYYNQLVGVINFFRKTILHVEQALVGIDCNRKIIPVMCTLAHTHPCTYTCRHTHTHTHTHTHAHMLYMHTHSLCFFLGGKAGRPSSKHSITCWLYFCMVSTSWPPFSICSLVRGSGPCTLFCQ